MDTQDHKTAAASTGGHHEGHEVHLCHRCGWPFPNTHPSARHRRAHKKVCGTIEGYRIIHSEEHDDRHLAVSDDDHGSDDEHHHTPSPNLVKKNAEDSGRVGEKSYKSEDDVYADAVTDFSDSGISSSSEGRFESVSEVDKSIESKSAKVDETTDKTEQSNEPTKREEMRHPGVLVNGNNESESVMPITDISAEAVSVGLINGSQPEYVVGDIQVPGDNLGSVAMDSEEGKISDHTLTAVGRPEELSDKSVSEVHDLPPQTETLQNLDASEGVNNLAHSTAVAPVDETRENIDTSMGVKEVSHSVEEIRPVEAVGENTLPKESLSSTPSIKLDGSTQSLDATEQSAAPSMVAKEVEPKTSLAGGENAGIFDASEGEKCDMNGDENRKVESKESVSVDTVSAPGFVNNTFAPDDDQTTRGLEKDVDCFEEKSNSELLETKNEKAKGASAEDPVPVISELPNDIHVKENVVKVEYVDVAETVHKLKDYDEVVASKTTPEQSIQKDSTSILTDSELSNENSANDNSCIREGTKASESIDSAEATAKLDGEDNVVLLTGNSESHMPSEDFSTSESVGIVSTAELDGDISASIPKDPTSILTDSELPNENSANDNSCIREGTKASESIDSAEATAKLDCEDNVVLLKGNSESHTPGDDFSTSKSVGIVSTAEFDGDISASDKCSVTPSLKQPVPSPLALHETSATGDYKTVIEDVTGAKSKSLQAEVDDKLNKQNNGVSTTDMSGSPISRSDSLEGNCGSVVSDTIETNSQKHKSTTQGTHHDKSDTFEAPSFMTLVQSGGEGDKVAAATEIESMQNNQQPKADALKAGWFPSLTNVVNESEGRKKNEEIIAKVTNWSPVKQQQQHGPLKSLLNEVKSSETKQVPTEAKDNGASVTTVGSVLGPEKHTLKDQDTNKDVEEWNSPARYPIEVKKEKKKGKPFWVPFVCCSSVHRDL